MVKVGKLTNDGNLIIKGEIDERLPAVTDGLVAHYPFDGFVNSSNLIDDKIDLTRPHPSSDSLFNLNKKVYAGEIYTISGYFKRSSLHDGRNHCMFDMRRPDGTIATGSVSSHGIEGWESSANGVEPLYHYFNKDIKNTSINNYVYWSRDIEIPNGFDGGEFKWIKFSWAGTPNTSETTSLKRPCLSLKGYNSYTPIVNNNNTLTDDGIAVEESTVNRINPSKVYNSFPSEWKVEEIALYTYKITALIDSPTVGYVINTDVYSASDQEAVTYSAQVVYKSNNSLTMGCGGFGRMDSSSAQGQAGISGSRQWRVIKYTPWQHRLALCYVNNENRNLIKAGDFMIVKEPQIESKTFPTSFTNTSRDVGRIDIPFDLKPPYSINVFHKPSKLLSEIIDQNASPMIFQMNTYHANASISFWNLNKTLRVYLKGDTGSDWSNNKIYKTYTNTEWDNKEHMYTLVAVDNRTFKVYMDGIYLGQQTSTVDVTNISYISTGSSYHSNAKYNDLSIYNKSLSDEEVSKLYKKTFSINNKGGLSTSKTIEKPNHIPKDAIHIPLDFNARDRFNSISPNSESNTVYEKGAVWVGTAVTNEYSYPTFNTDVESGGWAHWGSTGNKGAYGQNTNREFIYTAQNKYSHWVENLSGATNPYIVYQSPAFGGGLRSLQAIICMSDGSAVTNAKAYPSWNASNGAIPIGSWTSIERINNTKWYLCKAEGFSQDGTNNLVGIYVTVGNKIYVDSAQLERKQFPTPFTSSTRGTSELEFNLHRDYQLDWSKDWSIVYWKKPIGTNNNNFTGYSIESLGSNANSVGGGYTWFGKDTGANSISGGNLFTPNQYFGKWQMVSLTKTGSNITIKNWSREFGVSTKSTPTTTTVPNFYVNQYGYDLKLGGFDNTHVCNTWHRDLIVAKRAFSNQELEKMFKTNMSNNKKGLTINNQVIENQNLI